MTENKFKQEDKEKLVEFLNMVAVHGKFELTTKQIINYFKLLSHMQTAILPKIEANIFEVVRVHEPADAKKKPAAKKAANTESNKS